MVLRPVHKKTFNLAPQGEGVVGLRSPAVSVTCVVALAFTPLVAPRRTPRVTLFSSGPVSRSFRLSARAGVWGGLLTSQRRLGVPVFLNNEGSSPASVSG